MSNFEMSKAEVTVLFDLIGIGSIPVGIPDFPDVSEKQHHQILQTFIDNKLVNLAENSFHPDKGLEKFILPIIRSEQVIIFNYGINNKCKFNVTIYLSKSGTVALLEENTDTVRFLKFDLFDDLSLFVQRFELTPPNAKENQFISYIAFGKKHSIIHCAQFDFKVWRVSVVEAKKYSNKNVDEKKYTVDVMEYAKLLEEKLKEVYDAVNC